MALSDITFHQVGKRLFTDALNANFLREEKNASQWYHNNRRS